jgi:hypothetical protein
MSDLAFEIAKEQAERIAELEAELDTAMKVSINDQKMLEDAWGKNAKLREALEMISGKRQCANNTMSNQDIAQAALEVGDEP